MTGFLGRETHNARVKSVDTNHASHPSPTRRPRGHPGPLTEPLRAERCPRCNTPILRATTDGLDLRCDPTPLNHTSELAALLTGHTTYAVITTGRHYQLAWRDPSRINADHDQHVVATHHCNGTGRYDRQPAVLTSRPTRQETDEHPPF